MRLPNGYGTVYKLSGKRRKPFIARLTIGWEINEETKTVKQVYQTIGYYKTKAEGLLALAEIDKNPANIKLRDLTFAEVHARWSKDHYPKITVKTTRDYERHFERSKPLHNMSFTEIRLIHLEETLSELETSDGQKNKLRSYYILLWRYAMKHDIVNKNYGQLIDLKRVTKSIIKVPFNKEEIEKLLENQGALIVDMILFNCFSGWRPSEMCNIETSRVDLENGVIYGGMKTEAGIDRGVPIHSTIKHIVERYYDPSNKYLFGGIQYDTYYKKFKRVMASYNMDHTPNEGRHTFITMGKDAKMDEYLLKMIVGHAIDDVTEKYYTHRKIEVLKREIEKISLDAT